MNPNDEKDFKRLVEAVKESYRKMQPMREKRKKLIESFVGSDYSDDAQSSEVYLYFITIATNIYVRQLAVRAPTAKITSAFQDLRPMAKNMSLACDDAASDMKLGVTMRKAALDSLFSPKAVIKMGLEYTGQQDYQGTEVDVTEPFARKISFDDYVCDMSARSADNPAFEGDRYYLSKEEFEARYPGKWKQLGMTREDLGMQDDEGTDRAESISHAPMSGDEEIKDRVAMQDVWLTDSRKLVTYAISKATRPLSVIVLDAPEEGPYHSVWHTSVPDNAMPLPPFAVLRNVHELANSIFRRVASQSHKQKRVVGFDNAESANRFDKAKDGHAVHWDGQKPENIEVGGIDQTNLALFLQVKDIFSWAAGNLDSLGGLSPMAETAKQDEMLSTSANAQLADMQDAMNEFARGIFRQIAWYEWTDPVRERTLQKEIPGVGDYIAVDWNPETRQGDFIDFNFNINPHSMREDNPATKLQKIRAILTEIYGPLQPFMQQQGLTIDVRRLNEIVGDYANLPELEQLIVAVDPSMQPDGDNPAGNPVPGGKPTHTKRTYERINRPGATRVGKDHALMQTLLGGKAQPSEAAAAGRAVG